MKFIIYILMFFFSLLYSCKTRTIYVPVENNRIEYRDHLYKDSVFLHDSIVFKVQRDTVFVEKYKYLYRNRLLRDSIFRYDSIQVPYPVVEYKEVNKLSGFQNFQIWCGRLLLVLLGGYFIFQRLKS
ncbi:MAG: hypothetical protein QM660_06095 [Dysgonomonas sp.]